jgi:hypothetical protein
MSKTDSKQKEDEIDLDEMLDGMCSVSSHFIFKKSMKSLLYTDRYIFLMIDRGT